MENIIDKYSKIQKERNINGNVLNTTVNKMITTIISKNNEGLYILDIITNTGISTMFINEEIAYILMTKIEDDLILEQLFGDPSPSSNRQTPITPKPRQLFIV